MKSDSLALDICSRIDLRRRQLNLTQKSAGKLTGLAPQFFVVDSSRATRDIRAESVIVVSRAFGISTDYILTGRSTRVDRAHILAPLSAMEELPRNHLEVIIREYIAAIRGK